MEKRNEEETEELEMLQRGTGDEVKGRQEGNSARRETSQARKGGKEEMEERGKCPKKEWRKEKEREKSSKDKKVR